MPRPGRACSAYLLEAEDGAVCFDLGPGAVAKLQLVRPYTQIDAIVVSHMHADHFFDLVPLRQGLRYGPLRRETPLPVFLPPGGAAALDALRRAVAPNAPADFFASVYAVSEYDPERSVRVGGLRLDFARTRHYIEGYAIRAERDGASVTYSSDTAPYRLVTDLARDTDLFLCEASLGLASESGERGHSSAAEAGAMARRAGVRQLVLTHYGAADSAAELRAAARDCYPGAVDVADDGDQFSIFGSSRGNEN
jgi:ribonuclease BN (tRNA processing enzyme)